MRSAGILVIAAAHSGVVSLTCRLRSSNEGATFLPWCGPGPITYSPSKAGDVPCAKQGLAL